MSVLNTFLVVVGVITIVYFAILNGLYMIFTAIAWRSLGRHLRGRGYSAAEEACRNGSDHLQEASDLAGVR